MILKRVIKPNFTPPAMDFSVFLKKKKKKKKKNKFFFYSA